MSVIHLKNENLIDILSKTKDKLIVVDFFATWCGPCQMVGPIIENLAKEYQDKIAVYAVDIDKFQDLAAEFDVQSIPTIVFFKNSKELIRQTGFASIDGYRQIVEKNL